MADKEWNATTADWNTAGNWSGAAIPVDGDDVHFTGTVQQDVDGITPGAAGDALTTINVHEDFTRAIGSSGSKLILTSVTTVRFAGRLARALEASVTLLHVMSQLPLAEDASLDDLEASAEELIQRGSREGGHLSRMLALLAAEGKTARAVVRHGLVRDEIIAEAREGRYDLLVTGAHVTPGLNARLVGDLSTDILLAANRPVLVVH